MAVIHDGNGNAITRDNPLSTSLEGGNAIIPVDIQARYSQTIALQNAVALTIAGGATPNSMSATVDTDGFNEVGITQYSSVSHSGRFQIVWSNDGVTFNIYELPTGVTGTSQNRQISVPTKARYFKVLMENQDGVATPTVSVWAYLKA